MARRILLCVHLLVSSCVLPVSSATAAEPVWSQFRGRNAAGVAAEDVPFPVEFGPEKNCLWKTSLPSGHSSPGIWGNRVFLTGYDAERQHLETIALDRRTGDILWRHTAPAEKIERVHELGSPAASSVALDAERVYAYFGSFGLLCYDHAGKQLWQQPQPMPKTSFGTATSPILSGERLLLNYQGPPAALQAFDVRSGRLLWKNEKLPFPPGYSLPVVRQVGDVTEALVQGDRGLSAVDVTDGSLRWQVAGYAFMPIATPVLGDSLLYVVSFHPAGPSEDKVEHKFADLLKQYDQNKDGKLGADEVPAKLILVSRGHPDGVGDMTVSQMLGMLDRNRDKALDALEWTGMSLFAATITNALFAYRPDEDGRISSRGLVWKTDKALPESPSPLYYRGRLYTVKNGGIVSCYNAETGQLHFRERLGAAGSYYASPVAGDGKIYAASLDGVVVVFEAADELRVLARNDLGERLLATPALVNGTVYVRTVSRLYAFGR